MRELGKCKVKNCGRRATEMHHVFCGNGRRKQSDKYGFVVPLCREHHEEIHRHPNKGLDLALKIEYQKLFEEKYGSRETFRLVFTRSYL